jgi:hypothetical protein
MVLESCLEEVLEDQRGKHHPKPQVSAAMNVDCPLAGTDADRMPDPASLQLLPKCVESGIRSTLLVA